MITRKRRLKYFGLSASIALLALVVSNAHQLSEARAPEFENKGSEPATEPLTADSRAIRAVHLSRDRSARRSAGYDLEL